MFISRHGHVLARSTCQTSSGLLAYFKLKCCIVFSIFCYLSLGILFREAESLTHLPLVNRRLSDVVMEMANLTTNLCDVPGESSDCADSSEAHNLTLHQCARYGDECNMLTELQNISGHVKEKMNALDDKFLTPLHYAIRYNHLSVVKLLVDAGAGCSQWPPVRGDLWRGLYILLIKNGAEVNVVDIYGQTPLHYAAMSGNENAARDLLSLTDIYLDAQDMQGVTALHTAFIHSQEGVAAMLIEAGANLRCKDIGMATPLHHACSKGNVSFVQMLFDAASGRAEGWVMVSSMLTDRDVEESTCLHLAVDNGHYDVAKLFLEKHADVNVPRKHYMHPLHLAAMSGDIRNVKMLVEHNARIDVLNDEQATPLHKAVVFNHLDVVQYLVDYGEKIDRRGKDNYTPLLLAVTHGHVETAELLLLKGADYTAVDKNDKTVIFLAAEENKAPVLKKLLSYPNVKRMINGNESYVTNPVHVAAQEGYSEILVILLENGILPDSRNEEQQTPLHLAAMFGRISKM